MHELSMCRAIAETAVEHAGGRRVIRIDLRIGHLRQVVVDTLRSCWEMGAVDTVLEGCELVIVAVPATVSCRHCEATTTLKGPMLRCGACDSVDVEVVTGEELDIESIQVEPATAPGPTLEELR